MIDALETATRAIAGLQSVDDVLQVIVDQVRPLVGARYAALGIVYADGVIERFITSGMSRETRAAIGAPAARSWLPRPDHPGEPLVPHPRYRRRPAALRVPAEPPADAQLPRRPDHREGPLGRQPVPHRQGRRAPSSRRPTSASSRRSRVHAGIAIENARLHEQVQRLAIVDERERISQDLHDGIIQNIYAVGLSLEDVPELIREDPEEVERRVERAIDNLHLTIRDIRNFIFGLRPELLSGDEPDDRARGASSRSSATTR